MFFIEFQCFMMPQQTSLLKRVCFNICYLFQAQWYYIPIIVRINSKETVDSTTLPRAKLEPVVPVPPITNTRLNII